MTSRLFEFRVLSGSICSRFGGWVTVLLAGLVLSLLRAQAAALLDDGAGASGFVLSERGRTAAILVEESTDPAVRRAAGDLAADVERVTGVRPVVISASRQLPESAVIIGTFGQSQLIDELVKRGKIDVTGLAGAWESFVIQTVVDPWPGVRQALMVVGSDRRGAIYGTYDLSEAIGVSPWFWWADVTPQHRDRLVIKAGVHRQGPPSVKYRGIFINDEDWGLQPWAAKTFEPGTKDIGPKTYAKVFELLLRLKANYLWPAMHPSTKAFNFYPDNKVVAAEYGIVMGSSHAEPMLRNNVDEWNHRTFGEWDYEKNRDGVLNYWQQRLRENGRYENVYTIGMRGIHDGAMPGGGTTVEQVARLQRVIGDQRALLARELKKDAEQVPQIFVPYKEVLKLYQNGLKVPEDVTLVWPDDNHGYIRQLSNAEEQRRSGGSGVYYHVSYWGAPEDYLWLCTTPPALIWEEMNKAYTQGARNVWVLNVGDIKPAEVAMDFFLRMAWDIKPWNEDAQPVFLREWATRNFGLEPSAEIAAIMEEYYGLNQVFKPEHLLKAKFGVGDEPRAQRLQRFAMLVQRTNALFANLPEDRKEAFYELVVYPVRGSALMNERYLNPDPARQSAAYAQIQVETAFYNDTVAGGKWRLIMSDHPRDQPVYRAPSAVVGANENSSVLPVPDSAIRPVVAVSAKKWSRTNSPADGSWKVIAGLGRSAAAVRWSPSAGGDVDDATLEYDFTVTEKARVEVSIYCLPTHALHGGNRLRYAVSIDNQAPETVDIDTAEFSPSWAVNVLREAAIGMSTHEVERGQHTLTLRPLDPGVVFDRVVINSAK